MARKAFSILIIFILVILIPLRTLTLRADTAMTAQEQVNAMSVGWNLGNTLDSYGTWISNVTPQAVETAWGNPVTTRLMIASVKAQGFNTIRIPVTWAQFTDSQGNVDPQWMARVREVVDWSLEEGLYVILNVHHDTGEHGQDKVCWMIADMGTYNSVESRYAGLWTSIANEFKDYDDRLMFEGYNELLDMNNSWNAATSGSGAYDAVNSYAQAFVDTVRATGGNNATRNLIVNTYVASTDQAVRSAFVLPQDTVEDHLICEVHAYTPWQFCSSEGDSSYTSFDSNCQNAIDELMSTVDSFSDSLGVPVIIGEFGVENQNNDSDRVAYTSYYVQKAAEYGIRCIWWDNGISGYGGYGILDRNALTWNQDMVSALADNAPSGTPASADPIQEISETEAEETEQTVAVIIETSQQQDNVVEATAESSEAVIASETQEPSNSQNINGNKDYFTILLIVGIPIVLASYVGLFFLGRRSGRKTR